MNLASFLAADKSMIIAPAGYGKTYTIAEAIAAYEGHKKVLVLTHTHAGIASLKEKFEQRGLLPTKYHLDTICSFALNLTKTFHINKAEIPSEGDTAEMFAFAIQHAAAILRAKPIKRLLAVKYEHLIVDEYQDCSIAQHQMILGISTFLKTHILGDPLQGIFGFRNESVVCFEDDSFLPFHTNCQSLDVPWRWRNAGAASLGNDLARIRERLLARNDVNLRDYPSIVTVIGEASDYTIPNTDCKRQLYREISHNAVIIHPNSTSIEPRRAVVRSFPQLQLIEPIDGKDYYHWCQQFDLQSGQLLVNAIAEMMKKVCGKKSIEAWINERGLLRNKQRQEDKVIQRQLADIVTSLCAKKSYSLIACLIHAISQLPKVSVYRKEFIRDIMAVLVDADRKRQSATESLVSNRNIIRRKGRSIANKSIGTTLLTKGLEFDNVVILNAQDFHDPKHLYVALTRGSHRLVVITNSPVLHPY